MIRTLIIKAIHGLLIHNIEPKYIILGIESANEFYYDLFLEDQEQAKLLNNTVVINDNFPEEFWKCKVIIDPTKSNTYIGVLPSNNDIICLIPDCLYKNIKYPSQTKNIKFHSRE